TVTSSARSSCSCTAYATSKLSLAEPTNNRFFIAFVSLKLRCEFQYKIHWNSNSVSRVGNVRISITMRHVQPGLGNRNKLRYNSDDPKLPRETFFFNLDHRAAAVAPVHGTMENYRPSLFVYASHDASTKQWFIILNLRNCFETNRS